MFLIAGRRKIHYTFPDKTEMAEEYSMQNGEILSKIFNRTIEVCPLLFNNN